MTPTTPQRLALFLASTSAFLTASALAQSSVTISGFLDLSMEHMTNGVSSVNRQSTGQLNQSRLEFNSTEDLGGGTSAFVTLMMPFSPDTGAGSSAGTFSRSSFVGLRNANWGTIKIGRQQSLSDEVLASLLALRWGASTNYFLYYGNTTQLLSNAIRYESPKFGPVSFSGLYEISEGIGKVTEGRVTYAQGKTFVNGSYYVSKGHEFVEGDSSVKIGTLGASYDLGYARPAVVFQDTRTSGAVVNRTSKYSLAVNATIPMGAHAWWVDYGILHDRVKPGANARAASVRFDYYLSKRTFVYAGVAQIWNGSNSFYQPMGASGSYPVFTSATGVQTGDGGRVYNGHDTRSVLVGIRTFF